MIGWTDRILYHDFDRKICTGYMQRLHWIYAEVCRDLMNFGYIVTMLKPVRGHVSV